MLQTRSEELVARQADIEQLGDSVEALEQWLRAMEEYFSYFSGLPEPLMAAAKAQEPDNPLTIPCSILITTTDQYVEAAQRAGRVRDSVRGNDLFLAACSVAWIKGTETKEESLRRLRTLITSGFHKRDAPA
ncbi:SbtR family transcriptional regulator [Nocardia gipuzkoensis]